MNLSGSSGRPSPPDYESQHDRAVVIDLLTKGTDSGWYEIIGVLRNAYR